MQRKFKDEMKRRSSLYLGPMVYGKVPPQAKDLEEAILGAILIEKDGIDKVAEYLKPEHFYVEAHQRIFKAMLDLYNKSWAIDILTVSQLLAQKEELEMVGGAYYVTKLTNSVVSSANIEFHCRMILDKYLKRELIRLGGELIAGGYEEASDIKDLLDQHEKNFTALTTKGTDQSVTLDKALVKSIQRIEHLRLQNKHITGTASGYTALDNITHGWQDTDLVILAARPAVGKTAFALNLARNAIMSPDSPKTVAFFSLEMSMEQLMNRILAAESEIWLDKIMNGKLEEEHMKQLYSRAIQPLSRAKMVIDDTPMLTIYELRAKCRRLKRNHNIGLIIVDYLQLMSGDTNDSRNREREIAQISRGLKGLAKELGLPIIALSQLSREPEKRKGEQQTPKLSDLRESGAIEQDADVVMFMYRPEYYNINSNEMGETTRGETHISIAKHRNGKLAMGNEVIKLRADLAIQKFYEWDSLGEVAKSLGGGNWKPVNTGDEKPF